ncbi:MAG: ferritin-like fold-containing protein [Candidatus Nanopelagicales bacterium]
MTSQLTPASRSAGSTPSAAEPAGRPGATPAEPVGRAAEPGAKSAAEPAAERAAEPAPAPSRQAEVDTDTGSQPSLAVPRLVANRPSFADPAYREGVVELLALLGCGEYLAFERLVSEAALAPMLAQRLRVAHIAEGELAHFRLLRSRIAELGVDPDLAMQRFLVPLERYHRMTAPSDWLEGLVKAYVGDSIATDFYREVAAALDEDTERLVLEVCAEMGKTGVVVEEVRAAIADDPRVSGRLALWGRRLVGEMLSQAQFIAFEQDALTALILGDGTRPAVELTGLMERLTSAHVARMTALGLAA